MRWLAPPLPFENVLHAVRLVHPAPKQKVARLVGGAACDVCRGQVPRSSRPLISWQRVVDANLDVLTITNVRGSEVKYVFLQGGIRIYSRN
jgi:hypothetical protein